MQRGVQKISPLGKLLEYSHRDTTTKKNAGKLENLETPFAIVLTVVCVSSTFSLFARSADSALKSSLSFVKS